MSIPCCYRVEIEEKREGKTSSWETSKRLFVISHNEGEVRKTILGRCNLTTTKIINITNRNPIDYLSDEVIDRIMEGNKETPKNPFRHTIKEIRQISKSIGEIIKTSDTGEDKKKWKGVERLIEETILEFYNTNEKKKNDDWKYETIL